MNIFRRQSKWEKVADRAAGAVPGQAVKAGATALGTLLGAALVSAGISSVRDKREKS